MDLESLYYYLWQDDGKLVTAAIIATITLIGVTIRNPQSSIERAIILVVLIIVLAITLTAVFSRRL